MSLGFNRCCSPRPLLLSRATALTTRPSRSDVSQSAVPPLQSDRVVCLGATNAVVPSYPLTAILYYFLVYYLI